MKAQKDFLQPIIESFLALGGPGGSGDDAEIDLLTHSRNERESMISTMDLSLYGVDTVAQKEQLVNEFERDIIEARDAGLENVLPVNEDGSLDTSNFTPDAVGPSAYASPYAGGGLSPLSPDLVGEGQPLELPTTRIKQVTPRMREEPEPEVELPKN